MHFVRSENKIVSWSEKSLALPGIRIDRIIALYDRGSYFVDARQPFSAGRPRGQNGYSAPSQKLKDAVVVLYMECVDNAHGVSGRMGWVE